MTPLVSVITITYNRADLVQRAVRSALAQTHTNLEVIVVDDGSIDETAAVMAQLMSEDARVRFLPQAENKGGNTVRNIGLKAAGGAFIGYLDSDDEWLPEKLEKQLAYFAENDAPDLGVVYCGINSHTPDGVFQRLPFYTGKIWPQMLVDNHITGGGSTALLKREVFETVGGFDEADELRRGGAQEYELWIRVAEKYRIEAVQECLVNYYEGGQSVTALTMKNPLLRTASREYILRKHHDLYEKHPEEWAYRLMVIGCYYVLAGKGDEARKRFRQAAQLSKLWPYRMAIPASFLGAKFFIRIFWEKARHRLPGNNL
jgi:glycosyltransferase involved in cell wall biosynthesis